jgi:hypothetical protein
MNNDSQDNSKPDCKLSLKDTVTFMREIISPVAEKDWEVLEGGEMEIISAKILDSTHLELSQPISAEPGKRIQISIIDEGNEDSMRRDVSKKKFF